MRLSKIKNIIGNKVRNTLLYRAFKFRHNPIILEDVYGIRFIYYPWDHVPMEKHLSRRNYVAEFEAMKKIIKPGDVVFDAGANVGFHSVLFRKWAGGNGKVYSFEPVPETYGLLLETLALNASTGVATFQTALSDKAGSISMNIFEKKYSVWNSMGNPVYDGIKPQSTIQVATDSLDHFCSAHGISKINFLKIDVEGFEKFVFKGAQHLLSTNAIKVLSFEISKIPLEGSGVTSDELFDILHSHKYKIFAFNLKTRKFEGPIESSTTFYDNYFASQADLTSL